MKFAVLLMVILLSLLLGGAVPFEEDLQNTIFQTPFFFGLSAVFILTMLVVCRRYGWKKLKALQLMHIGVALLVLGIGIGSLFGKNSVFYIPVDSTQLFDQVPDETNPDLYHELGFDISVSDFTVETYPPEYALFAGSGEGQPLETATQFRGEYTFRTIGTVAASALLEGESYREQVERDGYLLVRQTPADKHYAATIVFSQNGQGAVERTLEVNHPATYGGWKFYLLSYDTEGGEYVSLQAKRDPGLGLVLAGIWLTMIATFWQCLATRPRHFSPALRPTGSAQPASAD